MRRLGLGVCHDNRRCHLQGFVLRCRGRGCRLRLPQPQPLQCCFGKGQQLRTIGPRLDSALHIQLGADDHVGQGVTTPGVRRLLLSTCKRCDVGLQVAQQAPRFRQFEHLQYTGHHVQTRWHIDQLLHLFGLFEELQNGVFGARQLHQGLIDGGTQVLPHLTRRKAWFDGCIRSTVRCGTTGQAGQCRLDKQQVAGERHQLLIGHHLARGLHRTQLLATSLEPGAQITTPDHAEGISYALYRLCQAGQACLLTAVTAHEQVELILHTAKILRQGIADCLEQFTIRATERTGRQTLMHLLGEIVRKVRRLLHSEYRRILRRRAGDVIQHVFQQVDREVEHCCLFPLVHDLLEYTVEFAEQRLCCRCRRLSIVEQCRGQRFTRVQQAAKTRGACGTVKRIEHIANLGQRRRHILAADPVQQCLVVMIALMMNQLWQITIARTRAHGFRCNNGI